MKKNIFMIGIIIIYFILILLAIIFNYEPGMKIGVNFYKFALEMIKIFPFAFILIGLFEVWVKNETIKKHLGTNSGKSGYFWAVLLGGCTIGPMIISLPVGYSLYNKGAKLSIVFTYIGAASICRIPMTIFEASCLGVKFTIIRYMGSLPLVIIFSVILGSYLSKKNYKINKGN